ncbi:hypothetical protein ACUR5C_08280 [Aliikangiella sp. IMCC44653]
MSTEKSINLTSSTDEGLLLSKIALLAQTGKSTAQGNKPTDEELAMLFDDQLDFERKQQVISHINADQNLMQQWIGLVEILGGESEAIEKKQSLLAQVFNWLSSWQGLTSGLVTASLVAVIFMMQTPSELSPGIDSSPQVADKGSIDNKDKSDNKSNIQFVSPDKRAISAGISDYIKTHKTNRFNHINLDSAIDMEGSSLEPELHQKYFQLGYLIAEQWVDCKVDSEQVIIDKNRLNQMTELVTLISNESFIPLDKSLAGIDSKQSARQLCNRVTDFLMSDL